MRKYEQPEIVDTLEYVDGLRADEYLDAAEDEARWAGGPRDTREQKRRETIANIIRSRADAIRPF